MSDRPFMHAAARPGVLFCLAVLVLSATAGGGIKCWTNKHGVRECGNVVPPEYSQEGYEAIGQHGMPVTEKPPAPTEEEILEQQREARERVEQERRQADQARYDRILLQTYTSEQDIVSSRDDKIATLETSAALAESRMATLEQDLRDRVDEAAAQERSGQAPAPELQQDIESLQRQIERNRQYIAENREEQARIRESHDAEIVRFRELKGMTSP